MWSDHTTTTTPSDITDESKAEEWAHSVTQEGTHIVYMVPEETIYPRR